MIMHELQERRVVLISQDSFYRGLTPDEHKNVKDYNFDHPNAMDQAAIMQVRAQNDACQLGRRQTAPQRPPPFAQTGPAHPDISLSDSARCALRRRTCALPVSPTRRRCHLNLGSQQHRQTDPRTLSSVSAVPGGPQGA